MKGRFLRLFLVLAALGWGISAAGVFLPWSAAVLQLQRLGAGNIPADPMLDYWLRMAAGAFTGIGIFFLVLALWPGKFRSVIPVAAVLMILEGLVLLVHGLRLGLAPRPFYADTLFCIVIGAGILFSRSGGENACPGRGAARQLDQ